MKEKIKNGVKTAYSKYGLKPESINKLVNIVEAKITAMGTLEDDKLDGVIISEIQNLEPFLGVMQSEIDYRIQKNPTPTPTSTPTPAPSPDFESVISKIMEPYTAEIKSLKEKLENQDKIKARTERLATVKEGLKAKGATKEPVLNALLPNAEFADSESTEQIVEKLLPVYDAKMQEFYGNSFAPRVPEAGKSKATEEAQKKTEKLISSTVTGLGILTPEKKD